MPEFHTKTLLLPSSSIDSWTLISFLRHFSKLEKFYYDHCGSQTGSIYPGISAHRVLQALSPFNPTLRSLTLVNTDEYSENSEHYGYCIGSLKYFTNLTYVDMSSDMIIGANKYLRDDIEDVDEDGIRIKQSLVKALPHGIQSLQIRWCGKTICKPLFELLEQKELFPSLHTLDIGWEKVRYPDKPSPEFPEKYPGFTEQSAQEFLELCLEKCITMKMSVCNPEPKTLRYYKSLPDQDPEVVSRQYNYPYDGYKAAEMNVRNLEASSEIVIGMPVVTKEGLIPF